MKRIRLGIYMDDEEYEERLGRFLMTHYPDQLELFLYTTEEQLKHLTEDRPDALLLSDNQEVLSFCSSLDCLKETVVISLVEQEGSRRTGGSDSENEENPIVFVDKYQDVNRIVDEIMKQVGDEVEEVMNTGRLLPKAGIYAVYSLAKNEFQLPFAVTTGAVFGERRHVLLLDLQENSGISQLLDRTAEMGLEELLVMASMGRFSKKKMHNCIGHINHVDLVYPVQNSENICQVDKTVYLNLMEMILQEMNYSAIIVNMGSRFPGFFDFLDKCSGIYLLTGKGMPARWREKEFFQELERQGYPTMRDRMTCIEIPASDGGVPTCERLVEQWKWTDIGSKIRRQMPEDGEGGLFDYDRKNSPKRVGSD